MRKHFRHALFIGLVAGSFLSCQKNVNEPTPEEVSAGTLAQIKSLGFNNKNVQKINEGYLVEGDIILTEEDLAAGTPQTPNLIIAREEHYRTFNLVNPSRYSTITVRLDNSSAQHQNAFSLALDQSIARYNAENLTIRFQRATGNKADITITSYYQISQVLGSAGFPTSRGAPYRQVQMNTYWYSTGTDATNVNYVATVMTHELGHCIGMRHTDFMNRAYSCGSGGNEGSGSAGAVHIAGTPTTPDASSWMLACIGDNVNRPFTANDKIALGAIY